MTGAETSLLTGQTSRLFALFSRLRGRSTPSHVRREMCNLTDVGDGFLRGVQYIILDRDPLYTATFRRLLRDSGVATVVLPAWSPNLHAFAERFVQSAKSECLERMVLLGDRHLRAAAREFVHHYHEERPHQGLGNALIAPPTTVIGTGPIACRERLGGLLKFYDRQAA